MAKTDRTTQVNFVLPPDVFARMREVLEERGWTLKHFVTRAIVRHMDALPPLAAEPLLAPCPPEPRPKPAKKRGRKPTGNKSRNN